MPNLEESVVSTLFDQSDKIANIVLKNNPLLRVLEEKNKIKRKKGGYELRKPTLYNDVSQGGFYSGYETFNLDPSVDLTAFIFAIRQAYEPVAISGRERRANRGEHELIDLVEAKIEAAIGRLKNLVSVSIKGDGTGFGGRGFDGIQKAVSTSPSSGTYGGIDRTTNTWARNSTRNVTLSAANVQSTCTLALMDVTRGDDMPDLAFAGPTAWGFLHDSMTAIQRLQAPIKKAVAGFRALNYDGCDFVFDGGFGGAQVGVNTVRFLNTDYWSFDMIEDADFKPVNAKLEKPIDQDAFFTAILVEGNLCCSAPALQNVIHP